MRGLLAFGSMRRRDATTASARRGSMSRAESDTHDLAEVAE
jgi:hypothetical protein